MLDLILPKQGYICVCVPVTEDKFYQKYFKRENLDKAQAYIDRRDAKGDTLYIAQATYKVDERKQKNTLAVRSFWLDIDCGDKKPYADQKEAYMALRDFCVEAEFPMPAVVDSGHGLYAHWLLNEDVDPDKWKTVARLFKKVNTEFGFYPDPSRTSDHASILRPVGTHNHKHGTVKDVRLLRSMEPMSFMAFVDAVEKAAKKKKIKAEVTAAPKRNNDINSEFQIYDDTPNSDAVLIADRCQQIDIMRKTQGDIEEPLWYASIGLLRYTTQSPDVIHEWSCGHADYSVEETDKKIKQHVDSGTGPTTCAFFGEINPRGCMGCPYKNKVKSPILLGRTVQAMEEHVGVEPPKPFIRATDGIYAPVDEINTCFYRNDLYVDAVSFDQSLGYEVVTIRHHLPNEGWMECMLRTADLTDVKSAMKGLFDNHVTVVGQKEKKLMTAYLESYADKLKKERKIKQLLCQMGWYDTEEGLQFILGQKAFMPDSTVQPVALAKNIPESAKAFRAKGELPQWIDTTRILGEPGMEPLAFAFLATGFGAPLMRFTGYAGALISMLGPSGVGKTLVGRWALSLYGDPDVLIMHKDDTKNALVNRLGVYNTLPLYIDEVTNIEGDALSELAYRITQGRDRVRLDSNAKERDNTNTWNTLALVSSNASLIDKLSSHKLDAGAEINRVFEFRVDHNPLLDRKTATGIYRTISHNYGIAGQEFIRYLACHTDEHRDQIDKVVNMLDKRTGASSEERFWSALSGCAIYGGMIAKKLGLIEFEVSPVIGWVIEQIKEMRGEKSTIHMDSFAIFGQFIDEHISNTLVINSATNRVIQEPRGALYVRRDVTSQLLQVNRNRFKEWVDRKYGSYTTVKQDMAKAGALLATDKRKTLGAGFPQFTGSQVHCWVVDMGNPALGNVAAQLVESTAKKIARLDIPEAEIPA